MSKVFYKDFDNFSIDCINFRRYFDVQGPTFQRISSLFDKTMAQEEDKVLHHHIGENSVNVHSADNRIFVLSETHNNKGDSGFAHIKINNGNEKGSMIFRSAKDGFLVNTSFSTKSEGRSVKVTSEEFYNDNGDYSILQNKAISTRNSLLFKLVTREENSLENQTCFITKEGENINEFSTLTTKPIFTAEINDIVDFSNAVNEKADNSDSRYFLNGEPAQHQAVTHIMKTYDKYIEENTMSNDETVAQIGNMQDLL